MTNVHKENVIVTLEERTMHLKLIRQKFSAYFLHQWFWKVKVLDLNLQKSFKNFKFGNMSGNE